MSRPQKPYRTSWGELIDGLYKLPDGRWRIVATGERFTERDEFTAVARFKQQASNRETVFIPARLERTTREGWGQFDTVANVTPPDSEDEHGRSGHLIDEQMMWEFVRKVIIESPDLAAQKLRIPQIASLKSLHLPEAPLRIATIIEAFESKNPRKGKSKKEALTPFRMLVDYSNAVTVEDLTTEVLLRWRAHIEETIDGPDTRAAYYSRVRGIIRFGLKVGLNAEHINSTLMRMQVLWTPAPRGQVNPTPISREDFHKLLEAGGDKWRAWLLCGLNMCMHLDEVCQIKWAELEFDKGTYASIRAKTQRKKIPQAVTLWPETIAALRAIPKRGESPYVFTSSHGSRFNRNTRGNDFADLREAAGVTTVSSKGKPVSFDWLRDGAYTAAIRTPGVDERFARIMAGHKSPGLEDNYVLRHPEITRPACEAVYQHYFGKK